VVSKGAGVTGDFISGYCYQKTIASKGGIEDPTVNNAMHPCTADHNGFHK
jgi:hypothetical protein